MAEKIEFTETVEENVNMLVENGRKVVLAGLGAVTFAQEELFGMFSNLVERGTATEEKTRSMVNKQVETRQKDAKKAAKRVEKEIEKRFENALHWMNIPSKNDIDKLSRKVTTLNKKVNDLSKAA
ncbi:phasin family protein [Candidatus Leptofilum sp.]|uniref:phasin family protein n=1 Tax=Candidatus Leptofilum sp. TaxID=3241576 RepID=UPI003B5C4EA2